MSNKISERNKQVAEMLADGNKVRNFYRFAAQNPHIDLYEACQIVLARPNASVCFSFEEWNAMERRVTRGRKGIPYYDREGNKGFVFDTNDTHGGTHYQRLFFPLKRMLHGLDKLNDTNLADDERSDYRKIHKGVHAYLQKQGKLSGDEKYDGLLIEGVAYSLYSRTGFPKENGVVVQGLPYSYAANAELFKDVYANAAQLEQSIEEAYTQKQETIEVIEDTEEDAISDELHTSVEQSSENVKKFGQFDEMIATRYKGYSLFIGRKYFSEHDLVEFLFIGKTENYKPNLGYDNTDKSLVWISENPKMAMLLTENEMNFSQQELIEKGVFTASDYTEYAELKKDLLSTLEELSEVKFKGTPFRYPDWQDEQTIEKPAEQKSEKPTVNSLYQKYLDVEKQYPDSIVVYRIGDFYEVMGNKAISAASILDITLTGRDVGLEERVPMCGFPYHVADKYIDKLLNNSSVTIVEADGNAYNVLENEKSKDSSIDDLKEIDEESPFDDEDELLEEDDEDDFQDETDEDEDYDEDDKPNVKSNIKSSKLEQRLKDRPRPQMSIFDLVDKSPQEQMIERQLKYGSGFQDGKFRIYDKYQTNPTKQEFAQFLRKEYGIGGFGGLYGDDQQHDGKGIRMEYRYENGDKLSAVLKWDEVAIRIADLIDEGNYLTEKDYIERERHRRWEEKQAKIQESKNSKPVSKLNRFKQLSEDDKAFFDDYQKRRYSVPDGSMWGEVQSCRAIANGVYEVSTPGHGGIMISFDLAPHILSPEALQKGVSEGGYYCYEEDCDACIPLRELYDKGILQKTNDYFTHNSVRSADAQVGFIPFNEATDAEKEAFFEEWNGLINSSLGTWNSEYWNARKQSEGSSITLTPEQQRINGIVDRIVKEGTENTSEGNWIVYFDEFKDDEQFVREHKGQITELLALRKEVAQVAVDDEGIDTTYYLDYCPNYEWKEGEKDENTDLNGVLDQNELGGAKTRYRNNVAAIKLVNKLYLENREPTAEEKKTLAKYVGWGGLAQVFDEKNEDWNKEYIELKQLLVDEDYERARGSVLNAHFTSKTVIDGIYNALDRFGVRGNNRILEPAMGTGNFFGYMPQSIADGSRMYGVELDKLTGRIAAKLYPQVNVQIKGFEETSFPNDRFDVVVGNVPFGGYTVFDSDYNKHNFYIHDYFIAKSIDKLRVGGVMAVVTSKGTLDKLNPSARKYIADRAELLGAIRLPNNAFKQTAGTEVVTDILFLRKREERINADTENTEWLSTAKTEAGYEINNYYIQHPEMVLGTIEKEFGLYGLEDITVKPDDRDLSDALSETIARLPSNIYSVPDHSPELEKEKEVDYNIKPLCYKAEAGKLYMRIGDEMVEQAIPKAPKDAYQRIRDMISLREELHHILDIQIQGCSDEVLEREQWILNAHYDQFVKRYGNINSSTNTRLFKDDGDSALLFACENVDEENKTITKSDVFSKRTIRPYTSVTSTDDCFEALQISKNERGRVDISFIEELTSKDYETILAELGDSVFRDPSAVIEGDKYSGFQTAEEYLSGYVKEKLQTAKEYAAKFPDFSHNVTALEEVQPTPLTAAEISVRLGASWVDKKYYEQFYCELMGVPWYYERDVELFYNQFDSSWRLDQKQHVKSLTYMNQREVYGTKRASASRLFEDCMNLRATSIYDTIEEDGKERRILNQAETIAAREKQNKIKEAFKNWIFADPERREELEQAYNSLFNKIRLPSYDGSYLKFPEMNPAIELKPHQKNAIHRIITSKESTLLHHVVGAGKTYTMIGAIMKMRQYGLCKKAMVTVPNHLVQQWAAEWRTLYPNAKLLIATKEDLEKDNRRKFVSKVALGDWDGIIIAQSSFAKIPISTERQIRKIREEIATIEEAVRNRWDESNMPRGAVKNLERIKKSRETALKKLLDDSNKDSVLTFENLGVDYLFIDEAHHYKNLFLFSKMNNVAGISSAASQRASDLKLKCEYLQELHGNDKGVVFATGTPISNSMTEMYTMQKYLQPSVLNDIGITYFDGWAADFGETVTSLELAPSGQGYKARTRFAKFTNLPELLTLYRSFADVQTADMVKLDVPEADRHVINLKPSDTVIELAEEIAERADRINAGGVDPREDNMLKITSDGKKLALDPRCHVDTATDEDGSKLNECAMRVFEIWQDTTDKKGTQIVFCDLSTPKNKSEEYEYGKDFDAYNDLKYKLVQKGIPAEEVAFIHDANTDEQKQALFDKVNSGAVRVLIGSTEKCGAGTNVQKRLVALHHLDTPYRPSDMQQREGRIIRQGNTNEKVDIFTYVMERTFDSYSYQILENKQRFISQIDRGDLTVREAEDIDETTLSYAEIKAITAANPKIKRKMEVDTEIARLRVLEGQYRKNLYSLQDKIRKQFPEEIRRQELLVERIREDKTALSKYNPEEFSINVNGVTFTDKKEGGRALTDTLYASSPNKVVAEYCGFKISIEPIVLIGEERKITLAAQGQYTISIGQSASGNLTRIDNFIADFAERERRMINKLEQLKSDLKIAEEEVQKPFEHEKHLEELLKEQTELNEELNLTKTEEVVIDDSDNDSSSDDDNYMALPEQRVQSIKGTRRKRLDEQVIRQVNKQLEKRPNAFVFCKNGDSYDIIGEQAEKLAGENGLQVKTENVKGKSYSVLSVSTEELDKHIAKIIGNGGEAEIIEPLRQKEMDFMETEDKVAALEVKVLPDYTIDQESMHENGYTWDGMLPIRRRMAERLFSLGVPIHSLHVNDTDSEISSIADLENHGGLFGVEKPDWNNFVESSQGVEYLSARLAIVEATRMVVRNEMDYFDAKYVDGYIDSNFAEHVNLTKFVASSKKATAEEMKPYVDSLLDEYTAKISAFPLEQYGWNESNVRHDIVNQIKDEELKAFAKETLIRPLFDVEKELETALGKFSKDEIDEMNLPAFDDVLTVLDKESAHMLIESNTHRTYTEGLLLLRNDTTGTCYVINDTSAKNSDGKELDFGDKTDVKTVLAYNGLYDGNPLREFNSQEEARAFFDSKVKAINEVVAESGNDVDAVISSVILEYDEFKTKMMNSSPEEIFLNNYKIHLYTEFAETIKAGANEYLTENEYKALRNDVGTILNQLYEDYIDREGYNVETYSATADFIRDYCEDWHYEVYYPTTYYGKDTDNRAYYRFTDGISHRNIGQLAEVHADMFTIAAPDCYLSKEELEENSIFYLKIGRDIDEDELSDINLAIRNMSRRMDQIIDESNDEWLLRIHLNEDCRNDIDEAIRKNFDSKHLKTGFENELIEKHGLERVAFIVATTINEAESDGRYSQANKEWAKSIPMSEDGVERNICRLKSHSAVVDGFANRIRQKLKEESKTQLVDLMTKADIFAEDTQEKVKAYYSFNKQQKPNGEIYFQAYMVSNDDGEIFPIFDFDFSTLEALEEEWQRRLDSGLFDVAELIKCEPHELLSISNEITSRYKDKEEEKLEQEKYLQVTARGDKVLSITKDKDDRNIAIIQREEKGDFVVAAGYDTTDGRWAQGFYDFKTVEDAEKFRTQKYSSENTEGKPERKWLTFKVSPEALIKKYQFNSRFMMPKGSGYEGCAYSVFNDRIRASTFTTDLPSDTRERALTIRIPEDERVELYEGSDRVMDFTAQDFIEMVDGTTADKYERETKLSIQLPREAIIKEYDNSVLVAAPTDSEYKGYIYYLPNSVISEDTESDNGSLVASVGENFKITLRKGEEQIELTAKELSDKINGKSDYKREPTPMSEYKEQEGTKWSTVALNPNAIIRKYDESTLLKMPKGEYAGLVCYIPNGMFVENEEGTKLRIPDNFIARLKDNDSEKNVELSATEFIKAIKDKTDEDYESLYRRPSEERAKQFEKVEENLRKNIPAEMINKPNWVIVRTSPNEGTGRLDKYMIDVHTGKAAKSNDSTTWTDFDSACEYAKEHGGVALAYALDGNDKIACIDLDGCFDENGNHNSVAGACIGFGNGTYCERSVSGKGLHLFGKTDGMDLRAFSKDGDLEFYQNGHFIAMTGDLYGKDSKEIKSLDNDGMKQFLESKCEKRSPWQGVGAGTAGLSSLDDREVVEKASNAKNGDTFKRLYNGEDLRNNHSNSDMSLMNQLAFWCGHDINQMLRIFATSGLFRADKPQSYYEHTAIKAVKSTPSYNPPKASVNAPNNSSDGNGKA